VAVSKHDELWAGVDIKLGHAQFFLTEMSASLERPRNAVQESAGTIIGNWQQSFYAYLDAFLAMARSVPEIINCCFGHDRSPMMVEWFRALDRAEQERRKSFSRDFVVGGYDTFRQHLLSTERNISFHRAGFPALVQVTHTGLFGVTYIGGPAKGIPIAATRPSAEAIAQGMPVGVFQQSVPVWPLWSDFTIDGKPLFDECRSYLELAGQLVEQARRITQRVHGDADLTPPSGLIRPE
jgi:hypothetical protein